MSMKFTKENLERFQQKCEWFCGSTGAFEPRIIFVLPSPPPNRKAGAGSASPRPGRRKKKNRGQDHNHDLRAQFERLKIG